MPLHALGPLHARLAVWRRRVQVVPTQDMTHRQLVDMRPEMRQGTLEPSIAPGQMVFSPPAAGTVANA
jgi:hypothetical protein